MKKMYKNPQTETVKLSTGDMMQGALIGTSPVPPGGEAAAPKRGYRPF